MATTRKSRPARKAAPKVSSSVRKSSLAPNLVPADVQALVAALSRQQASSIELGNDVGRTLEEYGYLLSPWQCDALRSARCTLANIRLSLRGLVALVTPEVAHG